MNQTKTTTELVAMPQAVVARPEPIQPADLMAGIHRLASDPGTDVAKMQALITLLTEQQDRNAKAEFHLAMVAAQSEMPRVTKDAKVINHKTNQIQSRYATLERIDAAVRPVYERHGFSISYGTGPQENNKFIITASVRHSGGHSEEYRMPLALDQSGSKNDTQGMGSIMSYGRRYLLCAIFNIITEGEDNDGAGRSQAINEEQALSIEKHIASLGIDRKKFLAVVFGLNAEGKTVTEIAAARYDDVMRLIETKRRAGV